MFQRKIYLKGDELKDLDFTILNFDDDWDEESDSDYDKFEEEYDDEE